MMIGLIVATGLKIGELLALRWRNLDLTIGTLSVPQSVLRARARSRRRRRRDGR
jgi:integrase